MCRAHKQKTLTRDTVIGAHFVGTVWVDGRSDLARSCVCEGKVCSGQVMQSSLRFPLFLISCADFQNVGVFILLYFAHLLLYSVLLLQ